jgi:FMN-dependent NADH-azoreductase
MAMLLYIKASPRDRSHSVAAADAFVEAYRGRHPDDRVTTLDLFRVDLPVFDGPIIQAKYRIMHGEQATPKERDAWRAVERCISEFTSADKYVIAAPMWNFGIPYRLKQYIDVIVQPTYTFAVTPQGYEGLLTGKRVFVAYARGGAYSPGTGGEKLDFQKPYLETILGFIGLTDVRSVMIEPTEGLSAEEKKRLRQSAIDQARTMAETF